jgi:hypothetical protein
LRGEILTLALLVLGSFTDNPAHVSALPITSDDETAVFADWLY